MSNKRKCHGCRNCFKPNEMFSRHTCNDCHADRMIELKKNRDKTRNKSNKIHSIFKEIRNTKRQNKPRIDKTIIYSKKLIIIPLYRLVVNQKMIAKLMNLNIRTIRRYKNQLIKLGFIVRQCVTCGTDISKRYNNAKRCLDCDPEYRIIMKNKVKD